MITVIVRTAIMYIILVGLMRITGKRQIGELQLSEFITTLLLSELAAIPITDINIPLLHAIIPIALLISIEIIISFFVTKSTVGKKMFDGAPSFLIRNGIMNQHELEKQRISVEEFLGSLRLKNIASPSDVEYAILEQNGQLSVFKKESCTTQGIAHPLVIDGKINSNNLKAIKKSERWLAKCISDSECSIEDIFLLTVDDKDHISIIIKNTDN